MCSTREVRTHEYEMSSSGSSASGSQQQWSHQEEKLAAESRRDDDASRESRELREAEKIRDGEPRELQGAEQMRGGDERQSAYRPVIDLENDGFTARLKAMCQVCRPFLCFCISLEIFQAALSVRRPSRDGPPSHTGSQVSDYLPDRFSAGFEIEKLMNFSALQLQPSDGRFCWWDGSWETI